MGGTKSRFPHSTWPPPSSSGGAVSDLRKAMDDALMNRVHRGSSVSVDFGSPATLEGIDYGRASPLPRDNSPVAKLQRQLGAMEAERDEWKAKAEFHRNECIRVDDWGKRHARHAQGLRRQLGEARIQLGQALASLGKVDTDIPARKLLKLCHPDRWQGTALEPLAQELTAWILGQKR